MPSAELSTNGLEDTNGRKPNGVMQRDTCGVWKRDTRKGVAVTPAGQCSEEFVVQQSTDALATS